MSSSPREWNGAYLRKPSVGIPQVPPPDVLPYAYSAKTAPSDFLFVYPDHPWMEVPISLWTTTGDCIWTVMQGVASMLVVVAGWMVPALQSKSRRRLPGKPV